MTKEQKLAELMVHCLVAAVVELVIDRAKGADDAQAGVEEAMKIATAGMNRISVTAGPPGQRTNANQMAHNVMAPMFQEIATQALAGTIQAKGRPKSH